MRREQKFLSAVFIIILSLACVFAATPVEAKTTAKIFRKKIKVTTELLPDYSVLVKVTNNNTQPISLYEKIVYKNGSTIIAENPSFKIYGQNSKSTIYQSADSEYLFSGDDPKPTSISTVYSLAKNYLSYKPFKNINKIVSGEITSSEIIDYDNYKPRYQLVNVKVKNISKQRLFGDVVILYYSKGKLVGSKNCTPNISKGESVEERKEYMPYGRDIKDDELIDSIKIVQCDLQYYTYD